MPPPSGTVIGYVLDSSGKPFVSVNVRLMQGDRVVARTVTNASGKFEFHNLAAGTYEAIAQLPGASQVLTYTVPPSGSVGPKATRHRPRPIE